MPELELESVVTARIDPKLGSVVMKTLYDKAPVPHLSHLKRIQKEASSGRLLVLLAPVAAADAADTPLDLPGPAPNGDLPCDLSNAPEAVRELVSQHNLELLVSQVSSVPSSPLLRPFAERMRHPLQVPRHAPRTREQYDAWGKLWPINFRPPEPHLGQAGDPTQIPAELHGYLQRHMAAALDLVFRQERGADCRSCGFNACLVVDPASDEVIASALDESDRSRLGHAAMLVSQHDSHAAGSRGLMQIHIPASQAVERVAERDRRLWPDARPVPPPHLHDKRMDPEPSSSGSGAEAEVKKRRKTSKGSVAAGEEGQLSKPYLCTGWDAFLVREPCAMCAMGECAQEIASHPNSTHVFYPQQLQPSLTLGSHGWSSASWTTSRGSSMGTRGCRPGGA